MIFPIYPNYIHLSPLFFYDEVNLGKNCEMLESDLIFWNKLKCESDLILTNGGSIKFEGLIIEWDARNPGDREDQKSRL